MQAIVETLFDAVYLVSVITIGILMIRGSKGERQFSLFGWMAVVLGAGDSFHLVPRALALCTTGLENYTVPLGLGKWITSVTMTVFYVLLYYVWRQRYKISGRRLQSWCRADRAVHDAPEPVDECRSAALMGHLPQYSLCAAWSSGDRAVLPQCEGARGQGFWLDVADHCAELWLLHSGSAVGQHHSHDRDVDDPQDMRLYMDGTDRIFRYETGR